MLNHIQQLLSPPVFEDEDKTRVAAMLNTILWAIIIIGTLYTVTAPFILGQYFSAALTAAVVASGILARMLMMRGFTQPAAIIILIVMDVILIISIAISDGLVGASFPSLVLTLVIAGVLLGGRWAYIMAMVNTLIGLGFYIYRDALPVPLIPQSPITFFSSIIVYLFFIAALLQSSSKSFEKILKNLRMSQQEVEARNQAIQEFASSLEVAIAARTKELDTANSRNERRAKQFEAITKISHIINQSQSLETLLAQLTTLISEQFNYYHTGVFLLDPNSENAVLIAANSAGGQKMLERNHKLKIGQTGIVGYVAGTGLPRIALDTGADAIYFNNPDLPDTRSEMALPLIRKGNEVIGVLDVQSTEQNAFSQEDIHTLSTLADQVAIAIENVQLFAEQERMLLETQSGYSRDIKAGWARYVRSQNITGIQRRNLKNTLLSEPVELPGAVEAIRSGSAYKKSGEGSNSLLTLPVKLRDQVVGVVNIKAGDARAWSEDELDIITAIMERAALSIENARLLEESRLIAEREHTISSISTKIGANTQLEEILKTVVRELGSQISGTQVTVEIGGGE
ncbi:hypothetical protein MASR2M66_08150 [Chloroflexota bacterium]